MWFRFIISTKNNPKSQTRKETKVDLYDTLLLLETVGMV